MPPYTSSPESTKYREEQEKLLRPNRPRVINGRQTFVKFLPQNDLKAIHPVYLADPADFEPRRHRWGDMLEWGIVELDFSVHLSMAQRIARHRIRDAKCFYHGQLLPQVQFINALMEKKKAKIAAAQKELRDFVLVVRLRSTKMSSKIKLLAPALGWTRNYHGYLFVDDSDGVQLGAPGASHIDLGFLKDNGHTYLDDDQFTLADVLPGPNPDKPAFHYIYDLGDYWFHDIYVEKILSTSESDGKLTLLAGGGACPREDGQGFRNWSKYIQSLDPTKHAEVARAMNGSTPMHSTLPLRSPRPRASPPAPRRPARRTVDFNAFLKDGLNGAAFQTEVVRDKRAGALCACCGKPITEPRMCAACKKVYYCDRGCQATHWKKEHKRLCAGRNATAD
ncbi:hypothetical protein DFH08DRAFT_1071833 [Mycena albidolilacea]|uniref:MYND-type domain-containing protein n=1 Tax=Mycena albidolilacea TaxID=1033008 RepID=A0AAD7F2Z0_9AGAR|nr:hypothetical protein DFH08DRAFT_1071833 [Mycena albidolilacea]